MGTKPLDGGEKRKAEISFVQWMNALSSRQLEECRSKEGRAEPPNYLQTSQAEVLSTKPNYQRILDEQGEVLSCMELVVRPLSTRGVGQRFVWSQKSLPFN